MVCSLFPVALSSLGPQHFTLLDSGGRAGRRGKLKPGQKACLGQVFRRQFLGSKPSRVEAHLGTILLLVLEILKPLVLSQTGGGQWMSCSVLKGPQGHLAQSYLCIVKENGLIHLFGFQ